MTSPDLDIRGSSSPDREAATLPPTGARSASPHGEPPLVTRVLPWAASIALTLSVHAALFWYLTSERAVTSDPIVEPAAVMVEMAPQVQQAFSQNNLAIGKPMEEAVDQPPPPPDPPDLMPSVEEAPVDAVAPLPPKPPKKPKVEKKPIPPKTPPEKAARKAAAKAADAPRSDDQAERTTAASSGQATAAEKADWKNEVSAAINRNKYYPSEVESTGFPVVRMTVAASGAVSSVAIVVSSGSGALDAAATDAVRRSSPLPPPPSGATSLTFRMVFHRS